jgi:serine/threonine-protein kinase
LKQHLGDATLCTRLLREAEALAAVAHPNIVHVLDAGEDSNGSPYVVLEYLEGRSLEGLIAARGALCAADALWVVKEVCAAVAAVHDAGFIHRDVKPSNVFVLAGSHYESLKGARIKLLDFGIASAHRFDEVRKLTQDNVLIGTLEYMAPERVSGTPAPPAVTGDVYGLGATLFECLTGQAPFEGDPIQIVAKLATAPPPSARSLRPDVPVAIEPILAKALQRDAKRRYPNVRELERELVAALVALGNTPPTSSATRRQYIRAPYVTPVRLEDEKGASDGRTEDLSANGLLVMLSQMPALGANVKVRFALPTTGEYVISQATVRWTRMQSGRARLSCAVGLEFVDLEANARAAIEKFVRIVGTEVERRG